MLQQNKAKLEISQEKLTGDAGLLLVFKFLESIGINEKFDNISLDDHRKFSTYSTNELLLFKLINKFAGYHSQTLQARGIEDPLFTEFQNVPSQPTISRLYKMISEDTIKDMEKLLIKLSNLITIKQDTLILDADSTYVVCNGKQDGSAHNVHYNNHGFHPLLVTEHISKTVLASKLRPGNKHCADGLENLLSFIFANGTTKNKNILLRADSAFCNSTKISLYEEYNLKYSVKLMRRDKTLGALINKLLLNELSTCNIIEEGIEIYGQIDYDSPTYGKIKISYKGVTENDGQMVLFPEYQIILSNMDGTAQEVFDFYNQRGASENIFRELKNDFAMSTLSHTRFIENEFDFLFSQIAYNIFKLFLQYTNFPEKSITLMRFTRDYVKVAAKVVHHARRIEIRLDKSYRRMKKFHQIYNSI